MARSAKEKLEALRRKTEKAQQAMEEVRLEEERLVAPTRDKIVSIVSETVDGFIRENMERIDRMKIRREPVADVILRMMEEIIMSSGQNSERRQSPIIEKGRRPVLLGSQSGGGSGDV